MTFATAPVRSSRWRTAGLLVLLAAGGLGLSGCASAPPPELRERSTVSDQGDAERRARVRLELASAYFSRGQFDTALDEVKLSIAASPQLSAAYNLRGLIYAGLGDEALAEDSFRRALQLDARDADAAHNYGWFQCQRQRFAEAGTLFQQALANPQYRDASRTLLARGICQARAGQLAEAEASLMRSYELDPANPGTAINLGDVLLRRGEATRARFYVDRKSVV
jgi:type IV pilus assembly protein PilF